LTRTDYSTEQFAGFLAEWKETFLGDVRGQTRQMLKTLLEVDAEPQMAEYLGLRWYERDYVTAVGIVRLRVPRTRRRSFLPRWLGRLERRSPEVAELIRQAFLRGVSTRAVGRVVALLTDEPVSAQTVSKLVRVLDAQV